MSDVNISIGATDKASRVINSVANKLGSGGLMGAVKGLGPVAVGVGAALAGATAAVLAFKKSFDVLMESAAAIDTLAKTAKGLGESATDLLAFQFAMGEFTGASPEKAADGLRKLQRAIGDAVGGGNADAFERLGINIASISTQEPVDQFKTLQRALSQVENASERASIAQKLLGRGAADLAPALLVNADAFEASIDAANRLSADLSGGGAEGIEAMNDAINRVKTGFQGVIDQIAVALAPVIESIATELASWLPPILDLAKMVLPAMIDELINIVGYAKEIATIFYQLQTFNFSGAMDTMESLGSTSEKWLKTVDEARQRARKAAEEAERQRAADRAATPETTEDPALKSKQDAAKKTIEQLERQLKVAQQGEEVVKRKEQLAMATNDTERERIQLLQQQIDAQEKQNQLVEDQKRAEEEAAAKRQQEAERRAQELQKMRDAIANFDPGVGATEGRLLTRGPSDRVPDKILKATEKSVAVQERIATALERPIGESDRYSFEFVGN